MTHSETPDHSPGTGNKVDHCVEVNEMVTHLRKYGSVDPSTKKMVYIDKQCVQAADLLAREHARRVEAIRLLKAVTTIAMNYAKPSDPAFAGHPHECCGEWISEAVECLNENGESI